MDVTNYVCSAGLCSSLNWLECLLEGHTTFNVRVVLVSQLVTQLILQLIYVASYGWWSGVSTWTHHHPSTNHNSPHRQVMTQVVPPDLFLMLGERSNCGLVEHLMWFRLESPLVQPLRVRLVEMVEKWDDRK